MSMPPQPRRADGPLPWLDQIKVGRLGERALVNANGVRWWVGRLYHNDKLPEGYCTVKIEDEKRKVLLQYQRHISQLLAIPKEFPEHQKLYPPPEEREYDRMEFVWAAVPVPNYKQPGVRRSKEIKVAAIYLTKVPKGHSVWILSEDDLDNPRTVSRISPFDASL